MQFVNLALPQEMSLYHLCRLYEPDPENLRQKNPWIEKDVIPELALMIKKARLINTSWDMMSQELWQYWRSAMPVAANGVQRAIICVRLDRPPEEGFLVRLHTPDVASVAFYATKKGSMTLKANCALTVARCLRAREHIDKLVIPDVLRDEIKLWTQTYVQEPHQFSSTYNPLLIYLRTQNRVT